MTAALKRGVSVRIHATLSKLLISQFREAQNRLPLLSNMPQERNDPGEFRLVSPSQFV